MQRNWTGVGLGLLLTVVAAGNVGNAQQQAGPPLPPLPAALLRELRNNPVAWQQFLRERATATPATQAAQAVPGAALGWTPSAKLTLSNPLQLTDGSVIAHVSCTGTWYRLTPSITGNYAAGTWKPIAPMPSGYAPRFFASAVLPDGRVIVEGGEYNTTACTNVETTKGAIYDPETNVWKTVTPPSGWSTIGDASAIVLANGSFLLSNCCTTQLATLNPTSLAWTATGTGKFDLNNEENWTLLPSGFVLAVDSYINNPLPPCGAGSEVFKPASSTWSSAGTTGHRLSACTGSIKSYEAPTQILRPNGTVVAFGATASTAAQNLPVYTAAYDTTTKKWAAGPKMPKVAGQYYTMADAPAAILTNGSVLIAASPGIWATASSFPTPTHFFIFDGATFTQVGDVANSLVLSSYEMNFLVLPTGQILGVETDFASTEIFPSVCCATTGWEPTITSISNTNLRAGATYRLHGTQLSGLTQGSAYGDDAQADSNFPLVRITNTATRHVFYARTFGFLRSVAAGAASATSFTIAAATETGPATLVVVANGIPSAPVNVVIKPAASLAMLP